MKKKALAFIMAAILIIGCSVGGTLAWLRETSKTVVNTFTVGNIGITLDETTTNYKMVPGQPIAKDPKVTVSNDSENCWLFVKIVESANLEGFISYTAADGWTPLDGYTGVYYRTVLATDTARQFSVLAGDTVTVKDTVTKEMMSALKEEGAVQPTLTFTAYAIQKAGFDTAAAAWAEAIK